MYHQARCGLWQCICVPLFCTTVNWHKTMESPCGSTAHSTGNLIGHNPQKLFIQYSSSHSCFLPRPLLILVPSPAMCTGAGLLQPVHHAGTISWDHRPAVAVDGELTDGGGCSITQYTHVNRVASSSFDIVTWPHSRATFFMVVPLHSDWRRQLPISGAV